MRCSVARVKDAARVNPDRAGSVHNENRNEDLREIDKRLVFTFELNLHACITS